MYIYTGGGWKYFTMANGLSGESNSARMIVEDFEGNMWILTRKSTLSKIQYFITRIDPETWKPLAVPECKISNPEKVYRIYEDNYRNVWFLSSDGITRYAQQ